MSSLNTSDSDNYNDNNSNTSYLDAYKALLKHRHWVVAFSGGLDSTVLLHSVYHFLQTLPNPESLPLDTSSASAFIPTLTAIHINHQLQTVSDSWEQHCQSVCDGLGVSLQIKKVAVQSEGKGLENAARQARYSVFEESLSADSVLLMGHHANDQAETLLMRLFRGAGTRGAAAMPMQRSLGQSQITRPLLKCSRADLSAYGLLNDLRFIEDPSNTDESFDRNFVRQQLLPKLEKRWPAIVSMLNRYSEHANADSELLTDLAQLDLKSVDCANDKYGDSLSIAACLALSAKRRANLLRYWLSTHQLTMPSTAQMLQIDNLLISEGSEAKVQLGAYRFCCYRDRLYLLSEQKLSNAAQALQQDQPWLFGEPMVIEGLGTLLVTNSLEDGIGLRDGEYTIGTRREGLRFRYRGMSRSLKKCFSEQGIPPWLRDHYPLLYSGDEVAAIPGILVCDDYSQIGVSRLDWQWV